MNWLPLHRNVQFNRLAYPDLLDSSVKDLIDVIKKPDFDRYDFEYRSLLGKKELFPNGWLDEVKDIHIISDGRYLDRYVPLMRAILTIENARRENKEPLEISLYFDSGFITVSSYLEDMLPGGKYLNFVWLYYHPLYQKPTNNTSRGKKPTGKRIYIQLFNCPFNHRDHDSRVLENQHYRYFDSRFKAWNSRWLQDTYWNDKNIKEFETSEELLRLMSDDICTKK